VRLVGAEDADVKAAHDRSEAIFVLGWGCPAGLTMDACPKRKREVAPKYA
jgi:hypothetical protein